MNSPQQTFIINSQNHMVWRICPVLLRNSKELRNRGSQSKVNSQQRRRVAKLRQLSANTTLNSVTFQLTTSLNRTVHHR